MMKEGLRDLSCSSHERSRMAIEAINDKALAATVVFVRMITSVDTVDQSARIPAFSPTKHRAAIYRLS